MPSCHLPPKQTATCFISASCRFCFMPYALLPLLLHPMSSCRLCFTLCPAANTSSHVAAFPFVLSLVLHHCVASSHVLSVLALDNCWHQVLSADPDEEHSCSDSGGSEEEEGSDYDYDDDFINDGTESGSQYDSEGSAEDVESG
eukprot:scaffold61851_cov18-Tisochrysis_lutea.AAC.2